jgi:tetratricopeptide (TPR) repeat protein
LGQIAKQQKQWDKAESLWLESLTIRRDLDNKQGIAYTLLDLGKLALEQGHISLADDRLKEALQIYKDLNNRLKLLACLQQFVWLFYQMQQRPKTTQLLAAIQVLLQEEAIEMTESITAEQARLDDELPKQLQQLMGISSFELAFVAGSQLDLQGAIALALAGERRS